MWNDRLLPEEVKAALNNFLWSHLPTGTTIGRAEEIACRWFADLEAEHAQEAENRLAGGPQAPPPQDSGRYA